MKREVKRYAISTVIAFGLFASCVAYDQTHPNKQVLYNAGPEPNTVCMVVSAAAPTEEETEATTEEVSLYETNLDAEIQHFIIQKCEESSISPALVIAIIEQESKCNASTIGDGGDSLGLMQIQPRWHSGRMEELGAMNLLDAYDNVTVGVDYLQELFEKNEDLYWVLMAYNGGESYANRMMESNIISTYAEKVSNRSMELEGDE